MNPQVAHAHHSHCHNEDDFDLDGLLRRDGDDVVEERTLVGQSVQILRQLVRTVHQAIEGCLKEGQPVHDKSQGEDNCAALLDLEEGVGWVGLSHGAGGRDLDAVG
jgi:hypothetical protein